MALAKLGAVRRAIIAPRSHLMKFALMVAGLTLATGFRLLLDRGANGVPFLTFLPVVLLAAVFLDGLHAVIAAIAAVFIVRLFFVPQSLLATHDPARAIMLGLYCLTIAIFAATGQMIREILLENEAHMAQSDAFNAELQHRTKNALQIMRALIARGPRSDDPATYYANLAGRLDALAKANELLRFGVLESCSVSELISSAMAPFERSRIHLGGEDCQVSRSAATPLMMALHELGTNACKYGALSGDHGQVTIRWQPTATQSVAIEWRETGGPTVFPPIHRGLGSRLLVPNGGLTVVRLDWLPDGLCCHLRAEGGQIDSEPTRLKRG